MRTIDELKKKQLAKEQELAALREEIRKQKSNDDFRKKMLLGGVVLIAMRSDATLRELVLALLEDAAGRSKVGRDIVLIRDLIDSALPDGSLKAIVDDI